MKYLVTGSSGFIGYHLTKKILLNKKNIVLGIDSHNNYYSTQLKRQRRRLLKKKNFLFKKINLTSKIELKKIINKFRPDIVYHLAGQPGVLYSFKNPRSYKENNTNATKILCEICKYNNVKKFIFASSSSVYGDQKKFPILENYKKIPKNYYAITKLQCEKIVDRLFSKSMTDYIIFRFFTVYGPLGRPDMFIHKYLDSLKKNKNIFLHNYGNNLRDFTYVEDVVKILEKCSRHIPKSKVFNICRSNPIKTIKLISLINKIYKKKNINIFLKSSVKGEMLKTHGSNTKLKNFFKNIKFTELKVGLKKTIKSFKKYGY
jgi:UDP-glucuronate 4-epimerase